MGWFEQIKKRKQNDDEMMQEAIAGIAARSWENVSPWEPPPTTAGQGRLSAILPRFTISKQMRTRHHKRF